MAIRRRRRWPVQLVALGLPAFTLTRCFFGPTPVDDSIRAHIDALLDALGVDAVGHRSASVEYKYVHGD